MLRHFAPISAVLLSAALASCVTRLPEPTETEPKPALSEAEALEVVRTDIRAGGRDPADSELSAKAIDGYWHVTAWRIFYRFIGGGGKPLRFAGC